MSKKFASYIKSSVYIEDLLEAESGALSQARDKLASLYQLHQIKTTPFNLFCRAYCREAGTLELLLPKAKRNRTVMAKKFMTFLEKEERVNIARQQNLPGKWKLDAIEAYRKLNDPNISYLEFEKLYFADVDW